MQGISLAGRGALTPLAESLLDTVEEGLRSGASIYPLRRTLYYVCVCLHGYKEEDGNGSKVESSVLSVTLKPSTHSFRDSRFSHPGNPNSKTFESSLGLRIRLGIKIQAEEVLDPKLKTLQVLESEPELKAKTLQAEHFFYSRPLKITGTSVSSQKENKERWGIILNHFLSTNHPMLAANQRKKEVCLGP